MRDKEIVFKKYETRGADYHYKQINKKNIFQFNAYVYARYLKYIDILQKYLKILNFPNDKKLNILDVGCGDGVLLYLISKKLKEYNFKFYGVDLSKKALSVARKKIPKGNFIIADVCNLRFYRDNYFDIVISSDVIEHVKYPEKMLKEINRVSKDGALIIIGTPIRYTESPLDKMHYREYFPTEFKNLMTNHFKILELKETHDLFYTLAYNKHINIFGLQLPIFRYFINLLSYLGFNPFMSERKHNNQLFSYMICVAVKDTSNIIATKRRYNTQRQYNKFDSLVGEIK